MRLIIFEDATYSNFYPLTYFRPIFALRCGYTSLAEKIERAYPEADVGYFVREEIADVFAESTDRPVNDASQLQGDDLLLINGRVLLLQGGPDAAGDDACACADDTLVWARISRATADAWKAADLCALKEKACAELPKAESGLTLMNYGWDPVLANPDALVADFKVAGKSGIDPSTNMSDQAAVWGPAENLYIGKNCTIQPHVTFDCTDGPITIDDGVKIEAGTRVEGPGYIGKGSRIVGGKIREGCSIGPVCRVGGEVEESIIHGYSNKYHDGFLGHAYVCEWVNLGAMTTNSDLKNDYSAVQCYVNGEMVDTGSTKVGSLIGDHTKTSIGTLLNTGAVVGCCCNLVGGSELLPKYAPSFTLYHLGRFFKQGVKSIAGTAATAMSRRGRELTDAQQALMKHVHAITKEERTRIVRKGGK